MSVAEVETSSRVQALEALVARMQREHTATIDQLAGVISERDNLRRAYRQLMEQFELLRRRIFIAKAERVDATQLELEFASTKQKLDELAAKLGAEAESGAAGDGVGARPAGKPPVRAKTKPKGRRNLADVDHLPERRIEIRDAELASKGIFIGWEESYKLGYQRPEAVRVVIARAKYRTAADTSAPAAPPEGATVLEQDGARFTILTAPLPRLLVRRGLCAPSMLARVIVQKFRFGMPLLPAGRAAHGRRHRARPRHHGPLGRGRGRFARPHRARLRPRRTQTRILPLDRRHRSRDPPGATSRRKAATLQKGALLRRFGRQEARLLRVPAQAHERRRLPDVSRLLRLHPSRCSRHLRCAVPRRCRRRRERRAHRGRMLEPRPTTFLGSGRFWLPCRPRGPPADQKALRARPGVGRLASLRETPEAADHPQALRRRVLRLGARPRRPDEQGTRAGQQGPRLRRATRTRPLPLRKAWLFFGSDDHAEAAANLYSLIASCKLHGLDPDRYLAEVIRVMPYWPRDRYLELAPAYWARTRERLDPTEVAAELGHVTVPSVPLDTAEQPPTS